MRALIICCLAGLLAFAAATAMAQEKPLINGIQTNNPPFSYLDASGQPAGFDVEALNWVAKRMGFEVVHQPVLWPDIIDALLNHKIDLICSDLSITSARSQLVAFSEPYLMNRQVFVARDDTTLSEGEIRKTRVRLGVKRASSQADLLESQKTSLGYQYLIKFYDNNAQIIEDVLLDHLDVGVMEDNAARLYIDRGNSVIMLGALGSPNELAVGLRKEDTALLAQINDGFRLLKSDPYWQQLKDKYLKLNIK